MNDLKDKPRILGLDFGNTIAPIEKYTNRFGKRFREFTWQEIRKTDPYPGAIEAISAFKERWFQRVHIISKCDPESEGNILFWLNLKGVVGRDCLIPERNLHFCRERADKAPICERLGITHFVDDRVEVLTPMNTVPCKYRFGNRDDEPEGFQDIPKDVVHVKDWASLKTRILTTF